jgi:hypothetical protein
MREKEEIGISCGAGNVPSFFSGKALCHKGFTHNTRPLCTIVVRSLRPVHVFDAMRFSRGIQ